MSAFSFDILPIMRCNSLLKVSSMNIIVAIYVTLDRAERHQVQATLFCGVYHQISFYICHNKSRKIATCKDYI